MDETSILQSVCSCIGGQQNVSRVLSSGNKRYLMVKDASAVDLTAVRQVEGVQAAELSRGRLTLELPGNDKEEKMDHKQVAQGIIENVGGKENIASFTHCATRLRLKLRDNAKANKDAVCKVKGVINVVEKGGQFQVVIGNEVAQVFDVVQEITGISGQAEDIVEKDDLKVKGKFIDTLIDLVTNIFTPILPALIGAGMIRALLMLCTQFGILQSSSGTYIMINEIYNAVFNFLPVYMAYCAAKRFKCNPMIAAAVALALVSSNLQAAIQSEEGLRFLGIQLSMPKQGYGSAIIPIIFIIWFVSVIEHFCTKHIHPAARNIVTPLVELVITVPVSFLVFGPIFSALQAAIGNGYTALYNLSPVVTGIVLGAAWQILVVFGLHWGIVPLGQVNLAMYGRNTINAVTGPSNWAQAGSAMGVALRTKNPDVKETAMSAAITGIFSITEPAIYGVNLKYKKPFYIAVVAGGIAGGIAGAGNAAALAGGPVGILSFPLFIGEGFIYFVIGMFAAFFGSMIGTYLFGYDAANDKA